MKRIVCLAVFMVLLSVSWVSAKIIFVGSHGGIVAYANFFSDGKYADPLEEFGITKDTEEGYIRDNVAINHGVDASIAWVRIKCGYDILARVYEDTANISDAYSWIIDNYENGDYVFLVGYSAGGKFVLNLSQWLWYADIPVHFLGMIDPVVAISFYIPRNVDISDVYIQRDDDWSDFFQGSWLFTYDGRVTDYNSYTVTGSDITHASIDNEEIVWRNLGNHMLYIMGINPDANYDWPEVEVYGDTAAEIDSEETAKDISEVSDEEADIPGSGEIGDANLTINWARVGYEGESDSNCVHELERVMAFGESVKIKLCTEIRNKGGTDVKNADLDYRIEDNRDFDDDDTKLHDEEDIDIPADSEITDCMRNVYVTVSSDGTSVKVGREDKSRTFPVVDGVAKCYLFVDVEGGGDHDISSETDHEEYGKMEITVIRSRATSGTYSWLPAILNYIMD